MRRPLNLNHRREKWQRKPLALCSRHTREAFESRGGARLKCQSERWMSSRLFLMLESTTFRGNVTGLHKAENVGVCVILSKSLWPSRCELWKLSFWISADWKELLRMSIFRDINYVFFCKEKAKRQRKRFDLGVCVNRAGSQFWYYIIFDISVL